MGDDDRSPIGYHRVKTFLDLHLCERIHAGCGLVQNEDRRILQEYTCQRHKLPLPHGQVGATLAHVGIQTIGEISNPVALAHVHRSRLDVIIGSVGIAIADVVADGSRE